MHIHNYTCIHMNILCKTFYAKKIFFIVMSLMYGTCHLWSWDSTKTKFIICTTPAHIIIGWRVGGNDDMISEPFKKCIWFGALRAQNQGSFASGPLIYAGQRKHYKPPTIRWRHIRASWIERLTCLICFDAINYPGILWSV